MKPMLACEYDPIKLRFPVFASPKLDGIRGLCKLGQVLSRSLKLIPNRHVQDTLSLEELDGLDGELIVGAPTAKDCYTQSVSHIMAHDKVMDFTFWVFDIHDDVRGYTDRYRTLCDRVEQLQVDYPGLDVRSLPQQLIKTEAELLVYEAECLEQGFEGVILRSMDGKYKFGRSTVNEGLLLKVKRFQDGECEILDFVEQMENTNEKKTNELGRSKRSTHAAGLIGKGTLGAVVVRDLITDCVFNIGTGFDDRLRAEIWGNKQKYKSSIWKYKFFPVGVKDLPRHPVIIGPRDVRDMS